jgi:poly-gamma-glutamate capsule biosynthesis protein CapA/YwtB (metallophosphatase superfamily)
METFQIVFVGDTSFGETYQAKIARKGGVNILESKGYDYSLEKVAPLLTRADRIIANLETPLTNLSTSPFAGVKKYIHGGDIQKTPAILAAYRIDSLSLANNHSFDYGSKGLEQTVQVLEDYGLQGFGAGLSAEAAAKPLTIGIGQQVIKIVAGFCSGQPDNAFVNRWSRMAAAQQITSIRASAKDAFIIAYPHWGRNYQWKTEKQTTLGHAMIEAGADIVIGHGAHALQEMECYQGKWIIYSLGNFVFNSPGRYQKMNHINASLVARLCLGEDHLRLYPILSDNQLTNYQPRPLDYAETQKIATVLDATTWVEKDEFGFFLRLPHLA